MALVTGGHGFLGRRLVDRLRSGKGWYVYASSSRDFDLTDEMETRRLFEMVKPDLVFHLAAEVGGIGANQANPGRYWYANLAMGMNVLEQARRHRVRKLIMVGTACSYPRDLTPPFREEELWDGYPEPTNAPYGVAKRALITGAQAYRDQYGLNAVTVIPANLYGPGDNFDPATSHVVPALIRKMVDAVDEGRDQVELWGTGAATRELLYVDDCVDALVTVAEKYTGREPLNVRGHSEISIKGLAGLVASFVGYHGAVTWDHSRPDGQPRRGLDGRRASGALGISPGTRLTVGLEQTVAWYREHRLTAV